MTRMPLKLGTLTVACVTIACLFGTNKTRADLVVVPNYATNSQPANSAEGVFATVTRHQFVYGASEFPSYPITITKIQWRPDIFVGGPITNATIPNIQINLSTTTASANHLNSVFAQNTGADDMVVFSGTLILSTSFTQLTNGTKAFDIDVPLQTPFNYDPLKGNLLLDVRNFSGADANIYDNSTTSGTDTVSRIFSSDPNSDTADSGDTGGGAIQVTYTVAAGVPTITSQPFNQQILVNSNVTFTVSAIGSPLPEYQWFFNDLNHPIVDATNESLTLSNVQPNQAGIYFAQALNNFGSTLSSNALLTIIALPEITSQPTDQTLLLNGTATFSVTVSSGVPIAFQWLFNDTNLIAGATNATLILTNVQSDQVGFYSVEIANIYGSVTSSNALLNQTPLIVPNYAAGFQANNNIINSLADVLHIQTVYGASQFPSYPIIITQLRWRPDTSVGGPLTNNIANIQVNLSTTATNVDHLNPTFAKNKGADDTIVFSGSVTVSTFFATLTNGTKAFDICLPLQSPFVYDSSKGNLLIDVQNFAGGSAPLYTGGLNTSDSMSRMFNGNNNATNASGSDSSGEAIQIDFLSSMIPPIISPQPTNHSVTLGGSATFDATALAIVPVFYQWFSADTNNPIPGATNSSLTLSNVQPSQAGNYFVLAANQYGSTLSSNALLTVTPNAPLITSQPLDRSGIVGTNFTFSVSTFGSLPLTYQWYYNTNTLLDGATNSSLTLTNIQFGQAGPYSVVVSNAFGMTNSTYAVLTMNFPPVNVLVGGTNIMGGNSLTLPVFLGANGNESALSFSLNFNTQQLTYASIDLGSGAADATLFPNTTQAANGRLGVNVQLPPGETFVPGAQEVARVTFLSSFVTNTTVLTPVNFTNQPVPRAVFDVHGIKLATNFIGGSVTLTASDFEADVTPRTSGDHSLDLFDWNQVGRFVAGLDTVSNASEFQRADCAPKSTAGDGQLKVTDWVQAGRYGAAIDAPAVFGGPNAPVAPVTLTGGPRTITITGGIGVKGLNFTIPVILQSQGNENAVGFSVHFDPALLKYVSTSKGSADSSATLLLNTNQAAAGTVGVLLALQSGNSFTNGTQAEIAKLNFTALNTTTNGIVAPTNGPVLLAISDSAANELAANYTNSAVTINLPPTLNVGLSDTNAVMTWPTWGTGFVLQGTGDLTQAWTNVVFTAQTNGGNITVTVPLPNHGGYFRLHHP